MIPPPEFLRYLRSGAPKLGDLPDFPCCFELWKEAELETFNDEYEVLKYAPGFFGFGSDGGGEMLAFDIDGKIYTIPFIGMSPNDAMPICDSWLEFESRIIRNEKEP